MQSVWLVPLLIYLGKILELALNSIRIVSIAKGFKGLAIIISILEGFIWIIIVTGIIEYIDNFFNIIAFALGMATGVYVGIVIEEKLALGLVLVRVITQKTADELLLKLRSAGFRVTDADATSNYGKVKILFATIKRKNLNDFTRLVKQFNPYAFFTVEEVRMASQVVKKSSRKTIEDLLRQFNLRKESSKSPPPVLPDVNQISAKKVLSKPTKKAVAKSTKKVSPKPTRKVAAKSTKKVSSKRPTRQPRSPNRRTTKT